MSFCVLTQRDLSKNHDTIFKNKINQAEHIKLDNLDVEHAIEFLQASLEKDTLDSLTVCDSYLTACELGKLAGFAQAYRVKKLNLSFLQLNNSSLDVFCQHFPKHLKSLFLEGNHLSCAGALMLIQASKQSSLEELDLSKNKFLKPSEDLKELLAQLEGSQIKTLKFRHNNVNRDLTLISTVWEMYSPSLTALDLSNNELGLARNEFQPFMESLYFKSFLEKINLSHNHISAAQLDWLATLGEPKAIKSLKLHGNGDCHLALRQAKIFLPIFKERAIERYRLRGGYLKHLMTEFAGTDRFIFHEQLPLEIAAQMSSIPAKQQAFLQGFQQDFYEEEGVLQKDSESTSQPNRGTTSSRVKTLAKKFKKALRLR